MHDQHLPPFAHSLMTLGVERDLMSIRESEAYTTATLQELAEEEEEGSEEEGSDVNTQEAQTLAGTRGAAEQQKREDAGFLKRPPKPNGKKPKPSFEKPPFEEGDVVEMAKSMKVHMC